MRLPLANRVVAFVTCAVCVVAILIGTSNKLLTRASYYRARADYHATLERAHRSAAIECLKELEHLPNAKNSHEREYLFGREVEQTERALRHATLELQYRRAASYFWERASVDLPLPYPWDKERDGAVLKAALLFELDERVRTDPSLAAGVAQIVVDRSTSLGILEDLPTKEILADLGLPAELATDIQKRNAEGPVPVSVFGIRSPRVIVDDLERLRGDAPELYPDAKRFVQVSLPGYSNDGSFALVGVTNALSNHPTGTILALSRAGGEWRVSRIYKAFAE